MRQIVVEKSFSYLYTGSLIIIISITTLIQYFYGMTSQLLIQSDQKSYVVNYTKIFTNIFSTVIIVILAKLNFNIHIVKLGGTLAFVIAPLVYFTYVKKKYKIINDVKTDENVLKQRWDGFAHHIAAFIHTNTDMAILTIFSTMKEVSVYSIYMLIINGIKSIISSLTNGLSALFGNMIANNEKEKLKRSFLAFDYLNMLIVFIIFVSTAFLIVPFVGVYTNGINDANYFRPMFAYIILVAEGLYTIRCSYTMIIYAAGHFRETKKSSYIEAIINIVLSLLLVKKYGIIGVAIGTMIAMLYRNINYIQYLSKNIIKWNKKDIYIKLLVNILSIPIICFVVSILPKVKIENYCNWILYAALVTGTVSILILLINFIFFKKDLKEVYNIYLKQIKERVLNRK